MLESLSLRLIGLSSRDNRWKSSKKLLLREHDLQEDRHQRGCSHLGRQDLDQKLALATKAPLGGVGLGLRSQAGLQQAPATWTEVEW